MGDQSGDQSAKKAIEDMSFEEALSALEQVVARLESGETALEDSIDLYTRGQALKAHCDARLSAAETKIEQLTVTKDGQVVGAQPFDGEGD